MSMLVTRAAQRAVSIQSLRVVLLGLVDGFVVALTNTVRNHCPVTGCPTKASAECIAAVAHSRADHTVSVERGLPAIRKYFAVHSG